MTAKFCIGLQSILGLSLLACGSDSKNKRAETVEEVLTGFGVDIEETPRLDNDMMPIGDDYSPLGAQMTLNKFREIQLVGAKIETPVVSNGRNTIIDLRPTSGNTVESVVLHNPGDETQPWFADDIDLRRAAIGDFDGDGLDETAFVFLKTGGNTLLQWTDDVEGQFAISAEKIVATQESNDIFAAAADVDGDGDDDVVIAFVRDEGIEIATLLSDEGMFIESATTISIPYISGGTASVEVQLAPGNLDRDNAFELAVLVNQAAALNNNAEGSTRYFVFDDLNQEYSEKHSGQVLATLPTETLSAVVGSIAVGDIDSDGMSEVVVGGLTTMGNTCGISSFSITSVHDDLRSELAPMAANKQVFTDDGSPCSSGASSRLNMYPVTLPDLDGDGVLEIHSFEYIYEDLANSPGILTEVARIPQTALLTTGTSGNNASYEFNWRTASFAAGEVSGDGRDDIVFFRHNSSNPQGVAVWGDDPIDGFSEIAFFETEFQNAQGGLKAQLLLPDVDLDQDTVAVSYSEGSYRLIFTEPIVMAVLAAPPCARDKGERVDDSCRTAFGKAVSEGMDRTDSLKFIAGVSVGFEAEFSTLGVKVGGAEVILNTRNTLTGYTSTAYNLTKQVVRETGVLEDSVIFSTLPLDTYTYTIQAHPNPELVGGEIQIRMPRNPITIMSTREFYNSSIEEESMAIDDSILSHTVGDPSTYPTPAAKNGLLQRHKGLESEQVDVGQGSGFTAVSISEFEETIDGDSYDFEATVDFRATNLTVVGGVSIGGGGGFDISTSRGSETLYQGTVANLASEYFPQDGYSFGLFSYIVEDSANPNPFEVINYWVAPSN